MEIFKFYCKQCEKIKVITYEYPDDLTYLTDSIDIISVDCFDDKSFTCEFNKIDRVKPYIPLENNENTYPKTGELIKSYKKT